METIVQMIFAIGIAVVVIAIIAPPVRRAIDSVSRVNDSRRRR